MKGIAKVTSKGQITVPVEIRDALGIHTGDLLAFEVKSGYAVVSRQQSLREVSDRLAVTGPVSAAGSVSDDEAIAPLFASTEAETDDTLYLTRRGE